jgi:hypothetical protein
LNPNEFSKAAEQMRRLIAAAETVNGSVVAKGGAMWVVEAVKATPARGTAGDEGNALTFSQFASKDDADIRRSVHHFHDFADDFVPCDDGERPRTVTQKQVAVGPANACHPNPQKDFAVSQRSFGKFRHRQLSRRLQDHRFRHRPSPRLQMASVVEDYFVKVAEAFAFPLLPLDALLFAPDRFTVPNQHSAKILNDDGNIGDCLQSTTWLCRQFFLLRFSDLRCLD